MKAIFLWSFYTGWWFQPLWKILVNINHVPRGPQVGMEHEKYLKPPPKYRDSRVHSFLPVSPFHLMFDQRIYLWATKGGCPRARQLTDIPENGCPGDRSWDQRWSDQWVSYKPNRSHVIGRVQPISKTMLVNLDHFPKFLDEHNKYLKTTMQIWYSLGGAPGCDIGFLREKFQLQPESWVFGRDPRYSKRRTDWF